MWVREIAGVVIIGVGATEKYITSPPNMVYVTTLPCKILKTTFPR